MSIVVAVFAVLLLLLQARSSELADEKAGKKLNEALQKQRGELTGAFKVGTAQVISATSETAKQTQKSASDQTDAIERQASHQFRQLQDATLGTKTCPLVSVGVHRPSGRPNAITVVNEDKNAHMYDLRVDVIESGPSATGDLWSTMLQQQSLTIPLIVALRASTTPFPFLSKMTNIVLQVRVTTRTTTCDYEIGLFDTGNNVWVDNGYEQSQDGKRVSEVKPTHVVADSKPDPQ